MTSDALPAPRTWRRLAPPILAALFVAACGGGGGDGGQAPPPPPPDGSVAYADPVRYSSAADASLADPNEGTAVTKHRLVLGGRTIAYTARAGHLSSGGSAGAQATASTFYVAYTADGSDPARRPVTFFYNGGPGSASVWLHLGSFGPKRLVTGVPATTAATPFPLVDNAQSLLDVSDLVFVDAIGSGYSQAIAPRTNASFWGVDADAEGFRDFVLRYLEHERREASPVFLFGESYGTTRTAVLAPLLEQAGVSLAGLVLQSSVLDYNANCAVVGSAALSCASFLPSYSAAGSFHDRVDPAQPDLDGFMVQMRDYATLEYGPAVDAWLADRTPPPPDMPAELGARTGIDASLWRTRFNLPPDVFQSQLLPGALTGRYDARMSASNGSALAREGDPSSTFITASFAARIGSYLRDTLRYTSVSTYVLASRAIESWDFRHDGRALPDTVPDLAAALALNPALRVLALNGYHDLATPFHQTERDLDRVAPRSRVQSLSYAGGHMTYLDDTSRRAQKADLAAFYRSAAAAALARRDALEAVR